MASATKAKKTPAKKPAPQKSAPKKSVPKKSAPKKSAVKKSTKKATAPAHRDLFISWDRFHEDSKALAWRLDMPKKWVGIIAITRGGLVPACIVARELDVRLVETLGISSYDHTNQRKADVLKLPQGVGTGKGWLVIDDLVDSGNTFKIARNMLPDAHFAAVYAKPKGKPTCDTYVTEISQDTWLHFPWDLTMQYSAPIAEQKTRRA
ncbi:xanthine phosphoribosyltransferase [Micavibrio aeruginosavorus]|uniref:xanthine phosphoribosyltransferase n=1 Tax=Micavibrio aeruginosavorus TaxID=349221 RepID=UPI003F4AC08D